jgi:hypothetical protein
MNSGRKWNKETAVRIPEIPAIPQGGPNLKQDHQCGTFLYSPPRRDFAVLLFEIRYNHTDVPTGLWKRGFSAIPKDKAVPKGLCGAVL